MQILVAVGFGAASLPLPGSSGGIADSAIKLPSYECGIVAEGDARGRFSVRFYMVAMLFILFDVEAVFMLPWAVVYRDLPKLVGSRMFGFWEMVVYLGFVLVGLFYVAKKGILDWSSDKADLCGRPGRPKDAVLQAHAQNHAVAALLAVKPSCITNARFDRGELTLWIDRDDLRPVCRTLQKAGYNFLVDVTCVDWYPSEPRFQVTYHILSHSLKERIRLCVMVDTLDH